MTFHNTLLRFTSKIAYLCMCYALTQRGAGNTGVDQSWWVALVDKSGNTDEYVNKGFLHRNREFRGIGLASAYVLCP
jgi:hypothetical protein